LFPIDWPEPFGLVMIESMACGTPVIAWRCGSVPEVIDDGVTGFVVEDLESAALAVEKCTALDRRRCRQVFENRFCVARMARDYVRVYRRLVDGTAARRVSAGRERLAPALDGGARVRAKSG
jgi:glycosyltransferase involved in cell wall biosynthesis